MRSNFILWLPVFGLFWSCSQVDTMPSTEANQNRIHQNYEVTYDAANSQVSAKAIFRNEGSQGTTMFLKDPSGVFVNDEQLKRNNGIYEGAYYDKWNLPLGVFDYSFKFLDIDKKEYSNALKIEPTRFAEVPKSFSKNTSIKFKWDGASLRAGETMHIYMVDEKEFFSSIYTAQLRADFIIVHTSNMAPLKPGKVKLQLVRILNKPLDEQTETGGQLVGNYYSEWVESIIEE